MRKTQLIGVSLVATAALSSACSEDLGSCDETEARRLIINNEGQVLYAGQAILNEACAAGQCHASAAKDALRQGAPKTLDFDLNPAPIAAAGDPFVPSGELEIPLDAKALSLLRKNQRAVFDNRNLIWTQIADGLMPPDGVGQPFRDEQAGAEADLTQPCEKKETLGSITSAESRKILRNWLACGSPVVEASDMAVDESTLTMTPAGLPGSVGQQMPYCLNLDDCDLPITFDDLHAKLFVPSCKAACHEPGGQYGAFDLETVEKAYASLMGDSALCGGLPFVTVNDPANSYILTKMGGETEQTICPQLMPAGAVTPLPCGTRQVAAWIRYGAPKPGDPAPDAGM